jgi:LysR family glycine cleavage system transcriptional activator
VVSPEASADRPAVKAFRAWLLDEAGAQAEAEAMRG